MKRFKLIIKGILYFITAIMLLLLYCNLYADELSFSFSFEDSDYEISAGIVDNYKDWEFAWENKDEIYFYGHSLKLFPYRWIDFRWERKDSKNIENFITSLNYPFENYKIKLLLDNNIITKKDKLLGGFEANFKIFKFLFATDFKEYNLFSFYVGKKIEIEKNLFIEPFFEAKQFGDITTRRGAIKLVYKTGD